MVLMKCQKKSLKRVLMITMVVIIFLSVIAIFAMKQKKQEEYTLMNLELLDSYTENIQEYKTCSVMQIDGKYYYYSEGAEQATEKIAQRLSDLDICVEYLDKHYSESKTAINKKVEQLTTCSCKTWEEYREYLNTEYYIDEGMNDMERAEKIVSEYMGKTID